jgi:nicotinate-nucleotide adenylyltransferase
MRIKSVRLRFRLRGWDFGSNFFFVKRIGLFGGTFDPVHLGHVAIASAALQEGVDHLVVMPCRLSPLKVAMGETTPPTTGDHRLAMLKLAMPDNPRIEISRYEIDGPELSYTWQSLEYLRGRFPEDRMVLIIGEDQYQVLGKWARIEDWSKNVDFLIFSRQVSEASENKLKDIKLQRAGSSVPTVSATAIRQALHENKSVIGLIPVQVEQYIRQHGLYQP